MRGLWLAMCLALAAFASPALAAPQRIVSLDMCADQMVLRLADRSQIAALSTEVDRGYVSAGLAAAGLKRIRPRLEDVLALRPDLIVRGYGGDSRSGDAFRRVGVAMRQLDFPDDLAGVRANVAAAAAAFGQGARGAALLGDFDRRLARAQSRHPARLRALYVTAGGATTGPGSLVDAMLRAAGLANAETSAGWRDLPLERLSRAAPDMIAAAYFGQRHSDTFIWSSARHPLARRLLQDKPVAWLSGGATACGGLETIDAIEALAAVRARIEAGR
ncbi:MAG: ABC transporter substrate-binding protein [Caulobacterales bacterium]|jgi:iron complex transport system substrate-binding protein